MVPSKCCPSDNTPGLKHQRERRETSEPLVESATQKLPSAVLQNLDARSDHLYFDSAFGKFSMYGSVIIAGNNPSTSKHSRVKQECLASGFQMWTWGFQDFEVWVLQQAGFRHLGLGFRAHVGFGHSGHSFSMSSLERDKKTLSQRLRLTDDASKRGASVNIEGQKCQLPHTTEPPPCTQASTPKP